MKTVIARIRSAKDWSQQQFCRVANLHQSMASGLETGYRKAGETVRKRVSKALGVPAEELFDENGWPLESEVPSV